MTLTFSSRGGSLLLNLMAWRHAYDFDAPELCARARLERLRSAIDAARRCNLDPRLDSELEYALLDCERLLALPLLDGDAAEQEMVPQRIARMRRIVGYHEGGVSRLNRRYWWVPFSIVMAVMMYCLSCDLAPRVTSLLP